jgi:hypothetical protein
VETVFHPRTAHRSTGMSVAGRSPGSRLECDSGPIAFPRRVTQWHCDGACNRLPLRGQRRNCAIRMNGTHRLPVSFLGRKPLEHLKRRRLYRCWGDLVNSGWRYLQGPPRVPGQGAVRGQWHAPCQGAAAGGQGTGAFNPCRCGGNREVSGAVETVEPVAGRVLLQTSLTPLPG